MGSKRGAVGTARKLGWSLPQTVATTATFICIIAPLSHRIFFFGYNPSKLFGDMSAPRPTGRLFFLSHHSTPSHVSICQRRPITNHTDRASCRHLSRKGKGECGWPMNGNCNVEFVIGDIGQVRHSYRPWRAAQPIASFTSSRGTSVSIYHTKTEISGTDALVLSTHDSIPGDSCDCSWYMCASMARGSTRVCSTSPECTGNGWLDHVLL